MNKSTTTIVAALIAALATIVGAYIGTLRAGSENNKQSSDQIAVQTDRKRETISNKRPQIQEDNKTSSPKDRVQVTQHNVSGDNVAVIR